MTEAEYKLAIERSRRLLAARGIRTGPNGGCDNCPHLASCMKLDPQEEVICELSDEDAGVGLAESTHHRGNKLTWTTAA